jgi:hypothetical protein
VAVAAKGFAHTQLIDCVMHRRDDRRRQRLRHIADAAANQAPGSLRIRRAKLAHAPGDLRKEIAGLELEVVVV